MDIWILVVALLAIAIILFIAAIYARDSYDFEDQIEELQVSQSQELFNIKTRISEIEKELVNPTSIQFNNDDYVQATDEEVIEEIELSQISDLTKEEVIRLYSQGFTMQEIANDVALHINTVQMIVDDYIENR